MKGGGSARKSPARFRRSSGSSANGESPVVNLAMWSGAAWLPTPLRSVPHRAPRKAQPEPGKCNAPPPVVRSTANIPVRLRRWATVDPRCRTHQSFGCDPPGPYNLCRVQAENPEVEVLVDLGCRTTRRGPSYSCSLASRSPSQSCYGPKALVSYQPQNPDYSDGVGEHPDAHGGQGLTVRVGRVLADQGMSR